MRLLVIGFMLLVMFLSYKAQARPDYIDFGIKINQHPNRSSLCKGDGMSKKLTAEVGAKAIYEWNPNISFHAGVAEEYCILNKKSSSGLNYEAGFTFRVKAK